MNSPLYTPSEQKILADAEQIRFSAYARTRKSNSLSPSPSKGDLLKKDISESTENLFKLGQIGLLEDQIKEKCKEKNDLYFKLYTQMMLQIKQYDDKIMQLCKEKNLMLSELSTSSPNPSPTHEIILDLRLAARYADDSNAL
jgi:hypothetical protein